MCFKTFDIIFETGALEVVSYFKANFLDFAIQAIGGKGLLPT